MSFDAEPFLRQMEEEGIIHPRNIMNDEQQLSDDARNALIWLSCSAEASALSCGEARKRIVQHWGEKVDKELSALFTWETAK